MKRSTILYSLLTGGVVLAALQHNSVYRDRYATREDCIADWPQNPEWCEPEGSTPGSSSSSGGGGTGSHYSSSSGSSGRWLGPSYEVGARPGQPVSSRALGNWQVSRGGFGSSGARFSASS